MIVITGGGTGGHLSIVKCLLESARKKNLKCIYIGSENGQDKSWFENEQTFYAKYFLASKGVVNQKRLAKFISLAQIIKLSFECKKILKKHKIKAVFSVGGYSSAPASFAALLTKTPLFIHEQNSKSGSLNTLLKPFATKFFSAFENEFCPYPVNEKFFKQARVRTQFQNIIFLGGSQGASFINNLALNLALKLDEKGIKIIHQCGEKDFEFCQKSYENLGIKPDLFAFSKNLELKMKEADLAVSRAGASTLFELCANQLPCIFIPYPYAFKNHQFFNAKSLQDEQLCKLFEERNFNIEDFFEELFKLNLTQISHNLAQKASLNGADILFQKAGF